MKRTSLLFALLSLPLQSPDSWRHEKFGSIRQNEVRFQTEGLEIQIQKSSSPLFYALAEPVRVVGLKAQGSVSGLPALKAEKEEGSKGNDDFALRVGLVYEGEDGPNWLQRWLAPSWIRRLISLSPELRFSKVVFYTLSQRAETGTPVETGNSRWIEGVSALKMTAPGPFAFEAAPLRSERVFGVWIQADGDDTQSEFLAKIQSLDLMTSGE